MVAYSLAIFTGAFLLFQVQPLMGKYLLPWFGGAPAVWTTCMLVFQILLLAGYLYAHLSRTFLSPRNQVIFHLGLLLVSIFTLPIVPAETWKPTEAADPTLRIIALLLVSLGLPYVILAATAPLLQHWVTRTHPGISPFRLYALSNLGSLLALLTYPSVFETFFTRKAQATLWAIGLFAYTAGCAWAAWQVWKRPALPHRTLEDPEHHPLTPPAHYAAWLLLPACAVILLLAITNKTSQDVAVIPLLWILPLAVYLLSFIICFDKAQWYKRTGYGIALAIFLLLLSFVSTARLTFSTPVEVLLFNTGLFVCCMVCHGELYRLRPAPARLTGFYLFIASGGALGGLFVAVIAPAIFPDYFELPLGLILCGALFLVLWGIEARPLREKGAPLLSWSGFLALLGLLGFIFWQDTQRYERVRVYRDRNFYGVLKVLRHQNQDPTLSLVELMHGQVAHGMQFLHPQRAKAPTLYFTENSGVGHAFSLLPSQSRQVGIVGLGVGTLAAYALPGDRFRFYEINPQVEHVARTYFSYLRDSAGTMDVVLGDARLKLEEEPSQQFDLLVLDAFSSDAIPLHLLTREAFAVYQRHLKNSGIIAVHISNRSVNLEPVLLNLARVNGLEAAILEHSGTPEQWWVLPSTWVVLSRNSALMSSPGIRNNLRQPVETVFKVPLWTDDFAALFPVLRWDEFFGIRRLDAEASARAGANLAKLGEVAAAIERFREAVALNPNSVEALNNLACLLATAPEPGLRNGPEAVRHAERACELTGHAHPILMSTLAAAYAQAGRFSNAAAAAERSLELAQAQGDQELVSRNQHFLQLYQQGQTYPYPAGSHPPPAPRDAP